MKKLINMEDKYNKLSHREKFLVLVVLMSLIFYISDVLMTEKNKYLFDLTL